MTDTASSRLMSDLRPAKAGILWILVVLCCLIEAILQLAEYGLILTERIRYLVYDFGAFWPGLLGSWPPNYNAQPYAMFFTHGFLHVGVVHLATNMIALWSLSLLVLDRVGQRGFTMLFFGSMIGGAVGYTLLPYSPQTPMIGASGALFGLAGGLLSWSYVDRFTQKETLWPVLRGVSFLGILNLVLWWAMNGRLAWETHLGGFLTGWFIALLVDPRPHQPEDEDA